MYSTGPEAPWHLRSWKWLYYSPPPPPLYTGETEAGGNDSRLKPDSQLLAGEKQWTRGDCKAPYVLCDQYAS